MWLCQVCQERHLDSQPVCPGCGGLRERIGRPFDPDTHPPSPEALAPGRADAAMQRELAFSRLRSHEIRRDTNPLSRTWLIARYFFTDLLEAYRQSCRRGPLGPGWWMFGALLVFTVLLFGALVMNVPRVPPWGWLASWGLAVLVGHVLIRHEVRRGPKSGSP